MILSLSRKLFVGKDKAFSPWLLYIDRKLRQTRHFNGGKDSKKTLKMLALAHYESQRKYFYC